MRKGKDVIGKPIVALEGGEKIDTVHDIIFDQDSNQVLAFVVDEGGWFHAGRVLPFGRISSIGPDAVVIQDKRDVVRADSLPGVKAILDRSNILKGTKLMTTDGRDLGKLADIYFDEENGKVVGYDVTGGMFADLASGRSFVPAPETITIGEDVAFVPPETAKGMEEQPPGGLKATLESVKDSVGSVASNAKEAVTSRQKDFVVGKTASRDVTAPDGAMIVSQGSVITPADADSAEAHGALAALFAAAGGSVVSGAIGSARESVTGAVGNASERTLEGTLGRRVGTDVRAEAGVLVAAEGQIVTESVIERAKRYDRGPQLVAAVYRDRVNSAGGSVAAAGANVKEGAANLLDRAKESLSDARDKASAANEQRRINAALGRPVTRVILDTSDNVILNLGELITHRAVEESRQAGVLEVLLDSVYTETPQLTVDDLRAPEPGRASLEQEHAQDHAAGGQDRMSVGGQQVPPTSDRMGGHYANRDSGQGSVSGAPSSDAPVIDPADRNKPQG